MFEPFNMLSLEDGPSRPNNDGPARAFYNHSSAQRVCTETIMVSALRAAHPGLQVTIIPQLGPSTVNLLGYAQATGKASYQSIVDPSDRLTIPLITKLYTPPTQRMNDDKGNLTTDLKYGKFSYSYANREYIIYIVDSRDGASYFPKYLTQYILHEDNVETMSVIDDLIRDAGKWSNTLHGEIWVFDQGLWQKKADLWNSVAKSRWEDVILAKTEKKIIREDVHRFFDGQERYEKYRIAWKRGVIYFGPPGNGKTISIKALSNELYHRKDPIPTLYVKTLVNRNGPEFSVQQIFSKARAEAPCLLVFEDLDSLITDQVRSYFLNEVDGLNTNQGVYMIGSTNYLNRLDPGLANRPSRFDRKFDFPRPDQDQRVMYCEYWRHKLQNKKSDEASADNDEEDLVHVDPDDLDFPKELSLEIAKITAGFSFAYMQEAFVATLLSIASSHDDDDDDEGSAECSGKVGKQDNFDDLLFWRVIKRQVALLKEQQGQ